MAGQPSRIKLLPSNASTGIDASLRIRSLRDVVLELVKNSLDASATNIEVRVDLKRRFCSVLDNGIGVSQQEFLVGGGLAKPHHTSRSSVVSQYGRTGCFLAALSAVALVSIFSSTSHFDGISSLVLRDGQRTASTIGPEKYSEIGLSGNGTKLLVHDLFGNYPVRTKHLMSRYERRLELQKDIADIKTSLLALRLAAPHHFAFRLIEASLDYRYQHGLYHVKPLINTITQNLFEIASIASIMTELDGLANLNHPAHWTSTSLSTLEFFIEGAFCIQPVSTRRAQFLSLGIEALGQSTHVLYEAVNSVFRQSRFGMSTLDYSSSKGSVGPDQEGGDRLRQWPMFYIRITTRLQRATHTESILQRAAVAVKAMAFEFIRSHHLCHERGEHTFKEPDQRIQDRKPSSTAHAKPLTLAARTRIQSAHVMNPSDLVSGLPFVQTTKKSKQLTSVPLTAEAGSVVRGPDSNPGLQSECFEWTDPRTGELLTLNGRTGAVRHSLKRPPSGFERLRVANCMRNIEETAQMLRANWIPGDSLNVGEAPVRSLISHRNLCVSNMHANISEACVSKHQHLYAQHDLSGASLGSKLAKEAMGTARVIGQVDKKFILARSHSADDEDLVILIDQHAADERVRVERLFAAGCDGPSTALPDPIHLKIAAHEGRVLDWLTPYLASWGIDAVVDMVADHEATVSVSALPEGIAERCWMQPKLLGDLLRREIWTMQDSDTSRAPKSRVAGGDWLANAAHCPQGILDLLISRACRSAIMFNDVLSVEQMQGMLHNLAQCVFPFQCAHGRPSVVPLMALGARPPCETQVDRPSFLEAWSTWN